MTLIAFPCITPENQHLINNIDVDTKVIIISFLEDVDNKINPFLNLPNELKFLVICKDLKILKNERDYKYYFPVIPEGCQLIFLGNQKCKQPGKTRRAYETFDLKNYIDTPFNHYVLINYFDNPYYEHSKNLSGDESLKNLSGDESLPVRCFFNRTMTKFEYVEEYTIPLDYI